MIRKFYLSDRVKYILAVLLFALAYTNAYATNNLNGSSLDPYDPAPKEVIYLAQSSGDEEPDKKLIPEEEEEEEEEEPECD